MMLRIVHGAMTAPAASTTTSSRRSDGRHATPALFHTNSSTGTNSSEIGRTSAETPTSAPKSASSAVLSWDQGFRTSTSTAHITTKLKTVSDSADRGVEDEVRPQGDDGSRHQTGGVVVQTAAHREDETHRGHAEDELEEPDDPRRGVGHEGVVHQPERTTEDGGIADRIERGRVAGEERVAATLGDLLAEHRVEERVVQRFGRACRMQDPQQAQQRGEAEDHNEQTRIDREAATRGLSVGAMTSSVTTCANEPLPSSSGAAYPAPARARESTGRPSSPGSSCTPSEFR